MQIDWFTFGAQVLNFLILVALLRHFLYGPVTTALDRREERIRSRRREAERAREEAEREAESYRRERRELESARRDRLREAEQEAERLRRELEEEARAEALESRERWRRSVERERESLLRELRERVAEHAVATTRELLEQLTDAGLEGQAVRTFARLLGDLDEAQVEDFRRAARQEGGRVEVRTCFELDETERQEVAAAVHDLIARELDLEFEASRELLLGMELRAGDRKIAWSAGDRLDRAEREVAELLESEVTREASA